MPSFNIAPNDVTPVLISRDHFCDEGDSKAESGHHRLLIPMLWGLIPFWHKGDYSKHKLTTNNCRLERMLESKLYNNAFKRGHRCVVLCEGFYEWQTKSPERAVYLFYMPQKEKAIIHDRNTWEPEDINLLKMAGVFDVWQDEQGDKIYSYSVITYESNEVMSWLHHRMPAVLETEQQITVKQIYPLLRITYMEMNKRRKFCLPPSCCHSYHSCVHTYRDVFIIIYYIENILREFSLD